MADRKFYSIGFNLIDNFTAKYDTLTNRISKITDSTHLIKIDVDSNSIIAKTEEMGKRVESSTSGISKSIGKVSEANKDLEQTTKRTSDVSKTQTNALGQLTAGYESLSGSLSKVKTVAAAAFAILGSGIIGGMTWKGAYESDQFSIQALEVMAKNKRIDLGRIEEFSKQASGSGYTSSTNRLSMAYSMTMRGAKNTDQAIGATEGIEKTFLKYDELLSKQYGITSMDQLAELATKRTVGRYDKQMLDDLFGRGFSDKSQSSRIKALGKVGAGIDVSKEMSEDPLYVIETRLKSISKSIGKELLGTFKPLTEGFAKFLGLIDKNPLVPKIAAIGVGLTTVLGILITIVSVLPQLKVGFAAASAGFTKLTSVGGLMKFASLLLSPYGILIAIGAILVVLAVKTGAFTAAWDKFSKSAIGKDVFSGIQGIADVIGLVVDKFGEWYEASGRSQLLTYFMSLVTILGHAYDFMDKIYSKTKSATGNPILAGMVALASMPVSLYAGGLKSATGIDVSEILSGISDRIGSLSRWFTSNLPIGIDKITGFLSKLLSVINWIVNPFIRLFDMIRSIFDKIIGFTESVFGGGEENASINKADEARMAEDIAWAKEQRFSDTKERKYSMSDDVMRAAWLEAATGKAQPHANMSEPGKYDRLVNEFKRRIQSSYSGYLENVMREAIPATNEESRQWDRGEWTRSGKGSMVGGRWVPSEPIEGSTGLEGFAFENKGRDLTKEAATGGDIRSDGLIKLHKDETVVPADIARSSRLNDLLRDVSTVGKSEQVIHIHSSPKYDFSGMKIASDIDIEKLFREIDARVEAGSLRAIRAALGQRRT